jgi:PIN domain nuclease of toxin-antitoxin system
VILLDKHIWFWWVQDVNQLTPQQRTALSNGERDGLGVSVISCWEVATLVAKKRLALSVSATDWVRQALRYPGIRQLRLTPNIAVASTELPGDFHPDPADRIIVATARAHDVPVMTNDDRIRNYGHVKVT